MRVRLLISLIFAAALLSSCTPAFSVRLFNRSGRDILVEWKDSRATSLRSEKDAIVGSAHDWSAKKTVSLDFGDVVASYRIAELWDLPREAMRQMRFPAAAGSRECCLEVGADFTVYALYAKTLQRLSPQPAGFPIAPLEVKKKPNQSPEPTPTAGTSAAEQPLVPAAVVAHL
jgi:hypothetical protein